MAFTVETGAGVVGANSYVSVADLKAYYALHPYPGDLLDATACPDGTLQALLVMATRTLESGVRWRGVPVKQIGVKQGLHWPAMGALLPVDPDAEGYVKDIAIARTGLENLSSGYRNEVPFDIVPQAVKDAVCELVRFLRLKDRDSVIGDAPVVKRNKVDVIEREFFEAGQPDVLPASVLRMVTLYVIGEPQRSGGPAGASAFGRTRA